MLLYDEKKQQMEVPELCRKRLLGYADSFKELAKSFGGSFESVGEDRRSIIEEHKLWENRQVICTNLHEMAQIMTQMAKEIFLYQALDDKAKKHLFHALKTEGILLENAYFIPGGEERKTLVLVMRSLRKASIEAEKLESLLSVLFRNHLRLSVNSQYMITEDSHTFLYVEEPRYMTLTGFARVNKDTESISGDNYSILESERGKITILLSDGTGSGEEACQDSGQVLDLMEKLLETGYQLPRAVNLVNAAMFAREDTIRHPTLDVCQMDLYQGCCDFCKVGGVSSFLKREKEVEVINGGNLPLGIFQNADIKQQVSRFRDGDYLIMLTDGVLDAFRANNYEEALCEEIAKIREQNPKEIAEKILEQAIIINGGHVNDDMTVMVAGIWENRQ